MPDNHEFQDTLGEEELHGVSLPLEVIPTSAASAPRQVPRQARAVDKPYSQERRRDTVRVIVTCGLLAILGYLVVFSTIESASNYPTHWAQTKEMLQILLPALTGIIGTVIGFYFGTTVAGQSNKSPDGGDPGA